MAEMNEAKSLDDLIAQHRALDSEVEQLSRRPYLTQAEQIEHAVLKKKRLRAKDQLFDYYRARQAS
jgi:uncharacterized protein YdcH (DUF465 family)